MIDSGNIYVNWFLCNLFITYGVSPLIVMIENGSHLFLQQLDLTKPAGLNSGYIS